MEKIININLSGRILPIEESAYEKLKTYIASLRNYFKNEQEKDEIINDIEGRMAELLYEKTQKGVATITLKEIEEVISSMGRPEDFEAELEEEQPHHKADAKASSTHKRLYRNINDKMLGGVCSGIANYLNIDPTIIRVLFAVLFFSGWAFLIYIILWIALPQQAITPFSGARMYRNPEQKILGGVASGLAAYFKIRVAIVRLLFLTPFILQLFFNIPDWPSFPSFFPFLIISSLSGTLVLIYLVLWIVLPKATTPYQKMEMRGEKVDAQKISEAVREKTKEMGDDIKSAAKTIQPIASGFFRAIRTFLKIILLFIAGAIAFALLIIIIGCVFTVITIYPATNFLWATDGQEILAWSSLVLFLFVPAVAIIVAIIRRIFNVRSRSNYLGWTFGGLWFLGWVTTTFFVSSVVKEIRYNAYDVTPIPITKPQDDKLIIAYTALSKNYNGNYWWGGDRDQVNQWGIDEDTLRLGLVEFELAASNDSAYQVEIKKFSTGSSYSNALERAKKIQFNTTLTNNVLLFDNSLSITKENKYRGQNITVQINVPVGKKIRFDKSLKQEITLITNKKHGSNLNVDLMGNINFEFEHFDWDVDTDYIMGEDGELKNLDGTDIVIHRKHVHRRPFNSRKKFMKTKRGSQQETPPYKLNEKTEKAEEKNEEVNENENRDLDIIESPVFSVIKF